MENILNIITGSKTIIAALVALVFVTGLSVGYQLCLHYVVNPANALTNSVNEFNTTFDDDEK
jgi:hypothetical protein